MDLIFRELQLSGSWELFGKWVTVRNNLSAYAVPEQRNLVFEYDINQAPYVKSLTKFIRMAGSGTAKNHPTISTFTEIRTTARGLCTTAIYHIS